MELDFIRTENFRAQFGNHFSVYLNDTSLDELICFTTRANASISQELIQPNRFFRIYIFFLILNLLLLTVFCIRIITFRMLMIATTVIAISSTVIAITTPIVIIITINRPRFLIGFISYTRREAYEIYRDM